MTASVDARYTSQDDKFLARIVDMESRVSSMEKLSQSVTRRSRNLIVNGAFESNQRGASVNYTGAVNPFGFTSDTWLVQAYAGSGGSGSPSVTGSTVNLAFSAGEPFATKKFFRMDVNSRATLGGGNAFDRIMHTIEDASPYSGSPMVWSFWTRANSARTGWYKISHKFGTGGSAQVTIAEGPISLTTGWQKIIFPFTFASLNGKNLGSDDRASLCFEIGLLNQGLLGGIGTTATGFLDLASVQCEPGVIATPFDHLHISEYRNACERYIKVSGAHGIVPSNGRATFPGTLPAMRATPTIAIPGNLTNAESGAVLATNVSGVVVGDGFYQGAFAAYAAQTWVSCTYHASAELL